MVRVVGVDDVVDDQPRDRPDRPAASAGGRLGATSRAGCRASNRLLARTDVDEPGRGVRHQRLDVRARSSPAVSPSCVATLQTKTRGAGRGEQGVADRRQQQARQQARVQAARAEDDELGVGDRRQGVLRGGDVVGRDPDALDAAACA